MKAIEGFEDYLVSSSGKIYSLKSNKYLKPNIVTNGYYQVCLFKNGKRYRKYIARLVAQAFISNPDNKSTVNHKDGIKSNNNISNLEWMTQSENQLHAFNTGLQKRSPNAGRPKVPIKVLDSVTGKFLSVHPSLHEAARTYGIFQSNIHSVLAGKYKQTGGLTFIRI